MSTTDIAVGNNNKENGSSSNDQKHNYRNVKQSPQERKENRFGIRSKVALLSTIVIVAWVPFILISLIAFNNQYTTRLPGWISSFLAFLPSLVNGNSEITIHPHLSVKWIAYPSLSICALEISKND
jgi:hypothetical protein